MDLPLWMTALSMEELKNTFSHYSTGMNVFFLTERKVPQFSYAGGHLVCKDGWLFEDGLR